MLEKIANEINKMAKIDQEAVTDYDLWWSDEGRKMVRDHAEKLKGIIGKHGWPTIPLVGKEASYNAWLLVQHIDEDLEFQKECLEILKNLPEGVIDRTNIAYLEDRVRKNQGLPQLYGTQWKYPNGIAVPYLIDKPEEVEERRKLMGLPSLEENKKMLEDWSKRTAKLKNNEKH